MSDLRVFISMAGIEAISTLLGFLGLIGTYWHQSRKALKTERAQYYFNLETESSRLFEIARQNPRLMRRLEDRLEGSEAELEEVDHEITWYLPQVLNLFEISLTFRDRGILDREVLATWIAWYYEVASYPLFPRFWEDLEPHYKPRLRRIMNAGVKQAAAGNETDTAMRHFYDDCAKAMKDGSPRRYWGDYHKTRSKPGQA